MDQHGLIPEALDRSLDETAARVVYLPNLQTPTGAVMPIERRQHVADILRRRSVFLIEDDAYGFLLPRTPQPISILVPDLSFYIVSFDKCLAPGLRVGAMIAPDAFRDRLINALRATGWMAPPILAEVIARLIRNGGLEQQVALKRGKAAARSAIARRVLGRHLRRESDTDRSDTDRSDTGRSDTGMSEVAGFHVWLELPPGRTVTAFITQAALAGITLAPPTALQALDPANAGVRLCLGAIPTEAELKRVLTILRDILESPEAISLV